MIVKSIRFLADYKQFKRNQIFQFSAEEDEEIEKIKFSVLVGRNGSGKTTLMSLIPTLFHYIERYNGKIPADFELVYVIENKIVKIIHFNNLIRVTVQGVFDNIQVVPMRDSRSNDFSMINIEEDYIEYSAFHPYTPTAVVCSTFSLHGEYPIARPFNYIGYQIVSDQSITKIYGNNHYNIGSISRGILRFIKLCFESNSEIKKLLKLFDLRFTNKVEHKCQGGYSIWETINKVWLRIHENEVICEDIYLNDIEFERYGRRITLSNMSSGEKMLLLRAISILNSIENNSIVIIEEPELHLDQVWNRQLTSLFRILYKKYNSHLIIATHDYSIINSVNKNDLTLLEYGKNIKLVDNTYLASYDELFSILYGNKFKENQIEIDFLESISKKSIDELKDVYKLLGNSIYKYLVYREIKNKIE